MKLRAYLREAASRLRAAGIEGGQRDANLLIGAKLGLDRLELIAQGDRQLGPAEIAGCNLLLGRRLSREPVARILGRRSIRITKKVGNEGRENKKRDGKQAGRRVKRECEPDCGENADVTKTLLRNPHVNREGREWREWRGWLVGSST